LNQSFRTAGSDAGTLARERAVAVALIKEGERREIVFEHLDELIQLADTAGADVADQVIQNRANPDPATWIGKGKAELLHGVCEELEADLVIVDDDLSPAQARNLERIVERRVVDRSGLILDIFARRAKSSEARTQVELAQLNYLLPRLTGAWSHLERQRGGIGMRGPGETQLETDRRLVRTRIKHLKSELVRITRRRATRRSRRSDVFKVALVGYTNAGKSTLLNRLTGAEVLVEDRLFATLDSTVRRCALPEGPECLLADTVGFIRKLPHHLVASFRSTLEEVLDAELLLHVIDLSQPGFEHRMQIVNQVLRELGAGETPVLHVFNKIDQVENPALLAHARQHCQPAVLVSATRDVRIGDLLEGIAGAQSKDQEELRLSIPLDRYDLVAAARRRVRVVEEHTDERGYHLLVACSPEDDSDLLEAMREAGCRVLKSGDR